MNTTPLKCTRTPENRSDSTCYSQTAQNEGGERVRYFWNGVGQWDVTGTVMGDEWETIRSRPREEN